MSGIGSQNMLSGIGFQSLYRTVWLAEAARYRAVVKKRYGNYNGTA